MPEPARLVDPTTDKLRLAAIQTGYEPDKCSTCGQFTIMRCGDGLLRCNNCPSPPFGDTTEHCA